MATARNVGRRVWFDGAEIHDFTGITRAATERLAQSKALLATLQGHTGYVWSAVFSPDGQRIVTASQDQTPRLWNNAPRGLF